MIRASLYITGCSARNRLRGWLKRLREPRYILGAVAVLSYLYFAIFARLRARRSARGLPPDLLASIQPLAGPLVGMWLLVMAVAGWLLPFDSGLLDFTPSEVDFLFPAPVSRRQLIIHRLLRSQVGLALAGIVPAVLFPLGSIFARARLAFALWLMATTGKVYFTGVTLSRTRGIRTAWRPLALVLGATGVVGVAVWRAVVVQPWGDLEALVHHVGVGVTTGASRIVLWPLAALAAPLFAPTPGALAAALVPAVAVFAVTLWWVLRADETLQDAAATASERRERQQATRARLGGMRSSVGLWRLAPAGRPEAIFAWKAAAQTLRVADRQTIRRIVILVALLSFVAVSLVRQAGLAAAMGMVGVGGAMYTVLLAPQILRIDLRQDLRALDLLKTWPLAGAAIVRGELIWPTVLLTAIAWVLLGLALAMSTAVFHTASLALRVSVAIAGALVAPALLLAQLAIHNAIVLVFPGWAAIGRDRARGFDAIGQRLITLGGTWVVLLVALLPGALSGALTALAAVKIGAGPASIVPGAAVCTAITVLEVALGTEALGPVFDRLDLLAVERGE